MIFLSVNDLELQQKLKQSEERNLLLEQLLLLVQSKLQKLDSEQTLPKLLPKVSTAVQIMTKKEDSIWSPEEEKVGKKMKILSI